MLFSRLNNPIQIQCSLASTKTRNENLSVAKTWTVLHCNWWVFVCGFVWQYAKPFCDESFIRFGMMHLLLGVINSSRCIRKFRCIISCVHNTHSLSGRISHMGCTKLVIQSTAPATDKNLSHFTSCKYPQSQFHFSVKQKKNFLLDNHALMHANFSINKHLCLAKWISIAWIEANTWAFPRQIIAKYLLILHTKWYRLNFNHFEINSSRLSPNFQFKLMHGWRWYITLSKNVDDCSFWAEV